MASTRPNTGLMESEAEWGVVVVGGGGGPGEIKRREVVLDPQESPEEIKIRRAGLRKLDFFCFSCSSAAVLRTLSL